MPEPKNPAVRFAIELARPDIITQRELAALKDLEVIADHLAMSIQLRMDAGADVEPGALVAVASPDAFTHADELNKEEERPEFTRAGLHVYTVESILENQAIPIAMRKEKRPCQN